MVILTRNGKLHIPKFLCEDKKKIFQETTDQDLMKFLLHP